MVSIGHVLPIHSRQVEKKLWKMGLLLVWIKVMSQVECSSWRDWAMRQTGLALPAGEQRGHGVNTLLSGFKWARLARNGSTRLTLAR